MTESRVCPRPYVSPCRDIENFREGVIRIFRIAIVSDEACIYSEVARSLFFLSDIQLATKSYKSEAVGLLHYEF